MFRCGTKHVEYVICSNRNIIFIFSVYFIHAVLPFRICVLRCHWCECLWFLDQSHKFNSCYKISAIVRPLYQWNSYYQKCYLETTVALSVPSSFQQLFTLSMFPYLRFLFLFFFLTHLLTNLLAHLLTP